ncbi:MULTISPECIES: aldo/keto reductase [unclassified Rhizobium]|uniref:aldo/keto reductase n=1 Tax=unclassified Rhizobium TaxID=2613769 RepID=UPI001047FA4D|nr:MULTISPECIES: aldo/keto reductase [unclassified Rhizobium]MBB3399376.1 2,5-diketo-D-gluconate reductase B [Rhizobium sp. BK060]MBB4166650.1 2,5-diketo-D-gluconate reductase B [Rhizobium sp. BK538]TCM67594.1 2,5-diketo-D-gluconate reductase B [Rhizobium sp. BK068]
MTIEPMVAGIPQMGYGTWNRSADEAYQGAIWALEAGCRHIDTAQGYGNEQGVARGIKDAGVPRSEIFITTKVRPENYGPGAVVPSVRESLEKLQTDQVDLLLLHWPSPHNKYPLADYVGQLAEVFDAGLAKRIGVSNFTKAMIDESIRMLGHRTITTNQVECHVYMQNRPIIDYCEKLGIAVTAYSPLARGAVVGDPVLDEIGKAHGATGEQVALAFLMAKGHIVIPSSSKKDRIILNFEARKIALAPTEIKRIEGLERGMRLVNGDWCPVWDV